MFLLFLLMMLQLLLTVVAFRDMAQVVHTKTVEGVIGVEVFTLFWLMCFSFFYFASCQCWFDVFFLVSKYKICLLNYPM